MKKISNALWAEFEKIKRSKVLFGTIVVFIFIPLMTSLMMFVARNPELASKLGIVGMKANIFGTSNWLGYFGVLNQLLGSISLIGFGFITTWVFASEHTFKTMKDIIALPINRSFIVLSKFIIISLWSILLSALVFVVGVGMGFVVGIEQWSTAMFIEFTKSYFGATILTLLLAPPIAFIAGYSRGIIAPLGIVIFTVILAQFAGLLGLGPYFPWSIPALYAIGNNIPGMELNTSSYVILVLTFLFSYWATVSWWKRADHH